MVKILTPLERFRISTESGRADVDELENPSNFYYTLRNKGRACIETLTFLAEYLPEKHQNRLFSRINLMPLIESILSVGSEMEIDGKRLVDIKGMPLKGETKSTVKMVLDKKNMKLWNERKKRIRDILYEIILFMEHNARNLAEPAYDIVHREDIGTKAIQSIKLQRELEKILE